MRGERFNAVDLGRGERRRIECGDVLLELGDAGCADQRARDERLPEHPRERELRERLPALGRDGVERTGALEVLGADAVGGEEPARRRAGPGRDIP